jgi:phage replication O-like protein O
LNGTQRRIIDVIFRQTYGYQRKSHNLSITFIAGATGIHKMQVQRELTKLIERKVITVVSKETFNKSRVIEFNKNYYEWIQLTNTLTVSEKANTTVSEKANTTVSESVNQTNKKENIKESDMKFPDQKPTNKSKYNEFFEQAWKLYPYKKGKSAVSMKAKKIIYEIGIDKIKKAIDNYKQELKMNTWKQPMNGSTFFNGRYEDYLPAEVNKDDVAKKGEIVFVR